MPLTPAQTNVLLSQQSRYGCGADDCVACYPIQYACDFCEREFDQPIALGEVFTCPECDWTNNEDNESLRTAYAVVTELLSDAGCPMLESPTKLKS